MHLFRCVVAPLDFLKTGKIPERKNHDAPLVSFSTLTTGKKHKRKFNTGTGTYTQIHQKAIPFQGPTTSTSMSVLPKKQTFLPKRQKQLTIDSFAMQRLPFSDPHLEEVFAQSSNPDLLSAPSFTISTSKAIISHMGPDLNPTVYSDETCISSVNHSQAARGIGSFYFNPSTFTDAVKFDLLCNVWKPGPDCCFPLKSLDRCFQQKWLHQFSWLA